MYELHENEQYFFDNPTLTHLADFVAGYPNPCCVCAPLLGKTLAERGVAVTNLDIDTRFADTPGFRRYDIYRPEWIGQQFGLIICDPPFFSVALSQLFAALRLLSRNDYTQPLLVSYLTRREAPVLGTFALFNLVPTGYHPGYQTVQRDERNDIAFYGNLGPEAHTRLAQSC